MDAIENFSIPRKLVNLTKICILNADATVMVGGRKNRIFKMASGIRQGDALSVLLFSLTLHTVMQNENTTYSLKQIHAYLDDVVQVARNMTHLVEMFQDLKRQRCQMSLKTSEEESKYIKISSLEA